jgi:hypothetical protein
VGGGKRARTLEIMIEELLAELSNGGSAVPAILERSRATIRAAAGRGDCAWVGRAEAIVRRDPSAAFEFDGEGFAKLRLGDKPLAAGRFRTRSIGSLRAEIASRPASSLHRGAVRLFVIDGASEITDVGALQAFAAEATLFQVASQFNCLEAPDPRLVPVEEYLRDPTQGPRAAVSCFPGALLRHYAAPAADGSRFVQIENGAQIELLAAIARPGVARVQNGYLIDKNIDDPDAFLRALEERFDEIHVGLHDGLEVVLGGGWDGGVADPPVRIAQAFTSTLAGGGYSEGRVDRATFAAMCRSLLQAAELGTLLGAIALGARRAVLTLIGGGVFGNSIEAIWEAILWAVDEVSKTGYRLDIVVNGRNLSSRLPWQRIRTDVERRGGVAIDVSR